jgi:predicted nucleic acid-binding protein
MIAIDTNILVYSVTKTSPWHQAARAVVRQVAEARSPWAIPWPCIHEFLGSLPTRESINRPRRRVTQSYKWSIGWKAPLFACSVKDQDTGSFQTTAARRQDRWPPCARYACCRDLPRRWCARNLDRRPRLLPLQRPPRAQSINVEAVMFATYLTAALSAYTGASPYSSSICATCSL